MTWLSSAQHRRRALTGLLALLALLGAIAVSDRLAERRAVAAEQARLANVARLTASSFQRQVDKFRLVATILSGEKGVGIRATWHIWTVLVQSASHVSLVSNAMAWYRTHNIGDHRCTISRIGTLLAQKLSTAEANAFLMVIPAYLYGF